MSRSTRLLVATSLVVAGVALTVSSCDSATSPAPPVPVLTKVTPVWSPTGEEYTNSNARTLPLLFVADQFDRPMAGVRVSFAVTAGGGTVPFPEIVTSEYGYVLLKQWILGPTAGENIVVATVGGAFSVPFRLVSMARPDDTDCWDC